MNQKTLVILFIALLIQGKNVAQNNISKFSLAEAGGYALQHNKTLLNANEDILLAEEQYKEARASGLPNVSASIDYTTYFNYEFEFSLLSGSTPEIDNSQLDAGDNQVLSYLSQLFSSDASIIEMGNQSNANLQVTQLIFSGQYWVGLKIAGISKKIAESNYENIVLDVKESVISSYYLILITEQLFNIVNENQENLREILKHTSDMYKVGMMEQTDVDQLRISLSRLENTKRSMERSIRLNYNMFRYVMGLESDTELQLTDSLGSLIAMIKNSQQMRELELSNNPTYQMMLAQEEIGKKSCDMQKWAYAPTLSAYYSHTEKIKETSFDLSPKNAAGITMNIPIFAGGEKKAQLSQAKIELEKIKRNKELLEEQLKIQNDQLNFDLKSAYENYSTQKENVDVAKRVYNNIYNKYKQGMVSSLDLTQANSNYLEAENNYVSAILELLQSKLKLDKLTNKL